MYRQAVAAWCLLARECARLSSAVYLQQCVVASMLAAIARLSWWTFQCVVRAKRAPMQCCLSSCRLGCCCRCLEGQKKPARLMLQVQSRAVCGLVVAQRVVG